MRRFLYVAGVLDVTWVLISLGGIITDPNSLAFWSQNLMVALLLGVFIAPALVFWRSDSSAKPSSRPKKVRAPRSPVRIATYAMSGLLALWLFVSLFGLFIQSDQVAFWGQSLMWSFIATILIAPLLVFVVNPFQDPVLVEDVGGGEFAEPFIPEDAYSAPSFLETPTDHDASTEPTFVDEQARDEGSSEVVADAREGWPWNASETTDEVETVDEMEVVDELEVVDDVPGRDASTDPASDRTSSTGTSAKAPTAEFRIRPPAADVDADEAWPAWPDDEGR